MFEAKVSNFIKFCMTCLNLETLYEDKSDKKRKKSKKERKFYFKLLFKFVDLEFVLTFDCGSNAKHRY